MERPEITQSELVVPKSELVVPKNEEVIVYARPEYKRTDFTKEQRNWIRRRDNFQCQHPVEHEHKGNLQVHHILAQAYAQLGLELPPDMINVPENAMTLCENIHVGVDLREPAHPEMLHPDHFQARQDYAQDKQSFQKVAEKHREMAKRRIKYWFTKNDDSMTALSIYNTRQEERKYNHPYPLIKSRL